MSDKPDNLTKIAYRLIQQCEAFADEQKKERDDAQQFYSGDPQSVPSEENFSSVVSMDVRAAIRKLKPSIMRTLLANDRIVEYLPAGPGDEESAEQATDYVNHVVVPESDAERAISDAIDDALLNKTGILAWASYETQRIAVQKYTGQSEEALLGLDQEGEIKDVEQAADGTISFTLRRMEKKVCTKLRAVPRGAFLIHPNAQSIEDSPLVGERQSTKRSDLVARGYDRELVMSLKSEDDAGDEDKQERRRDDWSQVDAHVAKAMEAVEVYDVYVQHDDDDDGIAEIHHLVLGDGTAKTETDASMVLLSSEIVSEVPYAEVVAERDAHQFEGHSVAEDLIHIQKIKTTLYRQMLDNIRWVNNPQPGYRPDAVANHDAVFKPTFGKPIVLNPGFAMADAVQWNTTPFVADKTLLVTQAMDAEAKERTGITDAAGGVDPETLQTMSATGVGVLNDAATAQAEMMIRSLSRGGIRKAFRGLLKLIIANADQPRTVRLRKEWVEYDPRQWNSEMDCVVNVGLGAGSRERDLAMLQMVAGMQEKIVAAFGPDNPMVKPEQVYNTFSKITEIAGFASADPYFTKPDPAEIAAKQEAAAQAPTPEQIKAEMAMQTATQVEQIKAQARTQVEAAQMEADLRVKQVEIAARAQEARMKVEADERIAQLQAQVDMKIASDSNRIEWARLSQPQQPTVGSGYVPS